MKRIVIEVTEEKKQALKDLAYLREKKSKGTKEVTMKDLVVEAIDDLLKKGK